MTPEQIEKDLKAFLSDSYPNISVKVVPWAEDETRLALYFCEEEFALLYPQQRYHYLIHSIPEEYCEAHLQNTVWFELAPGEKPEDLYYLDEELMESIAPNVLMAVERSGSIAALDDLLCPSSQGVKPEECHGDFRHFKKVLLEKGFKEEGEFNEISDICHVMMSKGGYCDCEVLFNVVETSRLKSQYWKERAASYKIDDSGDSSLSNTEK
jgi:hypothetical protein